MSQMTGSVAIFLMVLTFFVLTPAAIFTAIESWSFRESVYYTVVTLTTVGFGDFVPALATEGITSALTGLYKILSAAWLWIGLALVAALISEVQSMMQYMGKRCQCHHTPQD